MKAPPGSAEFQGWFAQSKAVNADGTPMRLYHGTSETFRHFQTPAFFAEDEDVALIFSGGAPPIAVYLSIQNPYRGYVGNMKKARAEALIAQGYDGGVGHESGPESAIEWVAFFPHQIARIDDLIVHADTLSVPSR